MNEILYNLQELNISVFHFFNKIFGQQLFNKVVIFADKFGGPHVFHYHLLLIIVIASIMLYHKKNTKNDLKELTILGFSALCTLFLSIILNLVIITDLLKDLTSLNRPYCDLKDIYTLPEVINNTSCKRGFPSGHMAFSVIMVTSFWPLLNKAFKVISIITLITIGITRISSGAHYPVDLLGAIIICLPLTLYIAKKTNYYIKIYEKRWKAFDYLYNKIFYKKG